MKRYSEDFNKLIQDKSVSDRYIITTARKYIAELEVQLNNERELNKEIKARFVKCNTCTEEMKSKCLMFSENLCNGERCEELVDLMSLVDKKETDDKAKAVVKSLLDLLPPKDILQPSAAIKINEAELFIKE
jgi:hypothetical protein